MTQPLEQLCCYIFAFCCRPQACCTRSSCLWVRESTRAVCVDAVFTVAVFRPCCCRSFVLQVPTPGSLEGPALVEHAAAVQSAVMMALNEHNTVAQVVSGTQPPGGSLSGVVRPCLGCDKAIRCSLSSRAPGCRQPYSILVKSVIKGGFSNETKCSGSVCGCGMWSVFLGGGSFDMGHYGCCSTGCAARPWLLIMVPAGSAAA